MGNKTRQGWNLASEAAERGNCPEAKLNEGGEGQTSLQEEGTLYRIVNKLCDIQTVDRSLVHRFGFQSGKTRDASRAASFRLTEST